ncbi:glycosyltransferase, partial [Citrobacter portucalensis]
LAPFDLPCLVVDDGSDETTRRTLEALAADRPQVTLLRLAENSGKGAAVMQ